LIVASKPVHGGGDTARFAIGTITGTMYGMFRAILTTALLLSIPAALRAETIERQPITVLPAPVVETDAPGHYRQERIQLVAELSMMTPTIVETKSQTERSAGGIPVGFAAVRIPFFRRNEWQTAAIFKVGLGTNRGVFNVTEGSNRYPESLRLFLVPMVASFEVTRPIDAIPFVKPALSVGIGGQYTAQENLNGERRDLWTPLVNVRPSLLFLQNTSPDDWFGGFSFGVTRWWGVGPTRVSSWSVDTALFFNL